MTAVPTAVVVPPPGGGEGAGGGGPHTHPSSVYLPWAHRPSRRICAAVDGRSPGQLLDTYAAEPGTGRRTALYLVGPRPGGDSDGFRRWIFGDGLPAGWTDDGHYLERDLMLPVLKYRHDDGRTVRMLRAAGWFDEGDYSAADADEAFGLLTDLYRAAFACSDLELLDTPATTGRYLLPVGMDPDGPGWPVLPRPVGDEIRAQATQHRIQVGPDGLGWPVEAQPAMFRQRSTLRDGIYGLDMRFGYAGLVRELGAAPATVSDEPADHRAWLRGGGLRYARGRFRATVTVPDGWDHVGLLPTKAGDGWAYPNEPGATFTTWADGAELLVAADAGWAFDVDRRFVLSPGRPLDAWAARLIACRQALSGDVTADRGPVARVARVDVDARAPLARALARRAVRNTVLQAVGAFHARATPITRTGTMADVPDERRGQARPLPTGRFAWNEPRPASWTALAHPEWSAAIWARCRAKIARAALDLPASAIVAIRGDCLYLDRDPGWPDDGQPGRLRVKDRIAGPVDRPHTGEQLDRLLARKDAP